MREEGKKGGNALNSPSVEWLRGRVYSRKGEGGERYFRIITRQEGGRGKKLPTMLFSQQGAKKSGKMGL